MQPNLNLLAVLALAITACAQSPVTEPKPAVAVSPPTAAGDPALLAVLWTQRAAEHHALCRQTFNVAQAMLAPALADRAWTAALEQTGRDGIGELPPAVVVDIDETVLDNSPFSARCAAANSAFAAPTWGKWVQEAQASALPGAVEFLTLAASNGVTVFYLTNRAHDLEPATRANLMRAGFPLQDTAAIDVVLCRNEHDQDADKGPRRARIAATHRILMLFGDDLNDFMSAVRPTLGARSSGDTRRREGEALAQVRLQRTDEFAANWGTRWFVLPNAMYGSWLDTLKACAAGPDGKLETQLLTKEAAAEPASAK